MAKKEKTGFVLYCDNRVLRRVNYAGAMDPERERAKAYRYMELQKTEWMFNAPHIIGNGVLTIKEV